MSSRSHYPDTPWRTTTPGDALGAMIYQSVRQALAEVQAERPAIQPRLYSVEQAAVYLSRPPSSIRQLVRDGRLPKASSDSRVLIAREDLDAFVEEERRLASGAEQ